MAMSIDRRASGQSRRRRVLYQTSREFTTDTPAQRRTAERLREARRPTASYGSHVNRRLRGRWYSLVPVTGSAMGISAAVVLGVACLLTLMHVATEVWQPLAYNVELARPFRLDRADSFGSWTRSFYLAAASLTSLLVYQLRRYKIDDYSGHYRIWRPIILLLTVLSIDSVSGLVPWFGAAIDFVFGKRVAMAGADWIRILLTVGGGALALRMIAEVRRSRIALPMMIFAVSGFAIPLLSRWGAVDMSSMMQRQIIVAAPLLAAASLWISIAGYLRMLFREVRGMDAESLVTGDASAQESQDETAPPRRWFGLRAGVESEPEEAEVKPKPAAKRARPAESTTVSTPTDKAVIDKTAMDEAAVEDAKPKRSWLPWSRRTKAVTQKAKPTEVAAESRPPVAAKSSPAMSKPVTAPMVKEKTDAAETPKRSWFGLGRAKAKSDGSATETKPEPKPIAKPITKSIAKPVIAAKTPESEDAAPKRKGLSGWFRGSTEKTAAVANDPKATTPATKAAAPSSTDAADDDSEDGDDDSVDWGSMNKTERRRMRKEMKRSGKAA